jgi:outer membrane protein, heavy metal efflux system
MMNRRILFLIWLYIPVTNVFGQQLPQEQLSLQQVVDLYIRNNLELEAARVQVERSKADRIAARLRPNPQLSLSAENLPFSGPTSFSHLYEIGTTYTETLELGGKKAQREKTAEAGVSLAEAQLEDTLRRGVAETKRLYYEVVLARSSVEVANENRQTFERLVQFNQTRFQEGAIPEVDLIKVRLERVKVDSAMRHAEFALRQATIRLLERLGSPEAQERGVSGQLSFDPVITDINALRQLASAERSDIRAGIADVHAKTERLALERVRAKPDLMPFAGYKRIGNDNTVLFGVNVPLKVRDKNQAEISRAESDLKAAELRLRLLRNRAVAEVDAAHAALQTAVSLVTTFQGELLKQADESQTITLAAYEEGGIELLPVLEAQRTRADVREQYFKTLFDYQTSLIALELAAGREIQREGIQNK